MFPTLDIHVLGLHAVLGTYRTMLAAGGIVGFAVAALLAWRRGLPVGRSLAVLASTVAAMLVGARALHVATDPALFAAHPLSALAPDVTGFALYGGLALAVVTGVVGARLARIDLWRLADCAAPGAAFGIALARVGCFGQGCCQGVVTHARYGIVFPIGSPAHAAQMIDGTAGLFGPVQPVVPTQLMEAGAALALGVAVIALGRRLPDGVAFLALAAGFSAVRLAVLPYRWLEPSFSAPSWFYPALYLGLIGVCAVLAVWRVRVASRASEPAGTAPATASAS